MNNARRKAYSIWSGKKPVHLKRNPVTIRLPQWMILRLKRDCEIGYLIEEQLAKKFQKLPEDYNINS